MAHPLLLCTTIQCIQHEVALFQWNRTTERELARSMVERTRNLKLLYMGDSQMEEIGLLHAYVSGAVAELTNLCPLPTTSWGRQFDSAHISMRWTAGPDCSRNMERFPADVPALPWQPDVVIWNSAALHSYLNSGEAPSEYHAERSIEYLQGLHVPNLFVIHGLAPFNSHKVRLEDNVPLWRQQQHYLKTLGGKQPSLDIFEAEERWLHKFAPLAPFCNAQLFHMTCITQQRQAISWEELQSDRWSFPPAFLTLAAVLKWAELAHEKRIGRSAAPNR